MKHKRRNVKCKPRQSTTTGTNEAFVNGICQDAETHSGLIDFDNVEVDSKMDAETLQAGLEKEALVSEGMDDGANSSLKELDAIISSLSRKAGVMNKSSGTFGSAGINASSNTMQMQGDGIHCNKPRSRLLDPRNNEYELNAALSVIKKIMKMDAAEPFSKPVDPIALGIPDYFDVIDKPMDFGTICNNLENGVKYLNSEDVFKDVQYIWENCRKYNKKGGYILELMRRVKKNFVKYWTEAGLHKGQPQAANGYSHLTPPTESTISHSKCGHICPMGPMTGHPIHEHLDFTGPSLFQHHQSLQSFSQAHQPHQRSCQCESNSKDLQPSQTQAESTLRNKQCARMCPEGPVNSNFRNHQQNVTGQCEEVQTHQPTFSYCHSCHPPQPTCQCQSSSFQPMCSRLQAGINICSAGHVHLPLHKESTLSCSKCGHMGPCGPTTGTGCHGQHCPMGLIQLQAYQPSLSCSHRHQLHQGPNPCHPISGQSRSFQPEDGADVGNAGHLNLNSPTESTIRQSKCRLDRPEVVVTDNSGQQQQDQTDPSQLWSSVPSSIKSQVDLPEQSRFHCESSSQPETCLPEAGANANINVADSTSVRRRGRGPTRCLKLLNGDGKRISITFNEMGQPVGPDAPKLTSFLGMLGRNGHLAPLTYPDWRAMPDANKENMWQQVQSKFDIHPINKSWVLKSLGKKWKDWKSKLKIAHYYTHATDEERLADRDERVLVDQWSVLIKHWNSEEAEKRSATNKANRAQQKFNHTTGTKSFARVREEQRAKRPDGKVPSRAELFILTRTRKNGQPVNAASSAVISELRERETQQRETSQNSIAQDDIFLQVMGQDRHGRLRTYGLGPSPSDVGGSKPTRAEALIMVSEANAEVHEMKERMLAMEKTCAQMAEQMATMMSMMSSMHKKTTDGHMSEVTDASGASEGSPQHQVHSSPSCHVIPSYETRARKRAKLQNANASKVAQRGC